MILAAFSFSRWSAVCSLANFQATQTSWNAALVLDQAVHTLKPALIAWIDLSKKTEPARLLLSDMVGGNLAAVHAVGFALHNIASGVNLMRRLYNDPAARTALSPRLRAASVFSLPSKSFDSQ